MMRWIKSYLAFTPVLCRPLIFPGMPAVVAVTLLLLPKLDFLTGMCVAAVLLMTMECILDYWVFGGIAARGGSQMSYLMSAPGRTEVLRRALGVNMLRQFLESGVILALWGAFSAMWKGGGPDAGLFWIYAGMLLLECFFLIVTLTVAHLFDGLWIHFAVSGTGAAAMAIALGLVLRRPAASFWVLLILTAAAGLASVSIIMNRIKENYYDRQD